MGPLSNVDSEQKSHAVQTFDPVHAGRVRMHESETQELAAVTSDESGGSFLSGSVIDSFWDQGGGTATIESAAKKKKPAKKPKPKPKPTKGPGCATKSDPTCRGC